LRIDDMPRDGFVVAEAERERVGVDAKRKPRRYARQRPNVCGAHHEFVGHPVNDLERLAAVFEMIFITEPREPLGGVRQIGHDAFNADLQHGLCCRDCRA
jgi:hypothetical protein